MKIDRPLLERFLLRLPTLRTLVVGDLMLDEYLWGKTERISPEAPVAIVDVSRDDLRLGGAGNVINNLATLGCQVAVLSVVGDDVDGHKLAERLAAKGIAHPGIIFEPGRLTTRKTRILAGHQQVLRIDREIRAPISTASEDQLLAAACIALNNCDLLLLSDYQKGVLTDRITMALIAMANQLRVPVVVDPKGASYRKYRGATLLTPNRKEAQVATGIEISDIPSLEAVGKTLCASLALNALLITRSEEGMSVFYPDGRHLPLPTLAREVFDVSGAGDTVLALIGVGLAAGLEVAQAAKIANIGAGIVVAKLGTSTVTTDELLRAAMHQEDDPQSKIHDRSILARLLSVERERGKKIVFTNGCFDLLHVGHVKYLQQARRLGDLLVLGLNTDASIRRLKGPKRPLIDEAERAHILAALGCIDYVVLFDEETPYELIQLLRPDILVKGGDYTAEEVVGRDLVESWGGRVELISFVEGKSTTSTIDKILEAYRDQA